jgi:hypothetical protein
MHPCHRHLHRETTSHSLCPAIAGYPQPTIQLRSYSLLIHVCSCVIVSVLVLFLINSLCFQATVTYLFTRLAGQSHRPCSLFPPLNTRAFQSLLRPSPAYSLLRFCFRWLVLFEPSCLRLGDLFAHLVHACFLVPASCLTLIPGPHTYLRHSQHICSFAVVFVHLFCFVRLLPQDRWPICPSHHP